MFRLKSILLASVAIICLLGAAPPAHAATKLYCPGKYCKQVQDELKKCAQLNPKIKWPGPSDGIYGPLTAASIRSFQAVQQIKVDGLVGPVTWHWLMKVKVCDRRG